MKKTILLVFSLITLSVYGSGNDSLRIITLQQGVDSLLNTVLDLQQQYTQIKLTQNIVERQQQEISTLKDSNHLQQNEIQRNYLVLNDLEDTLQEYDASKEAFTRQTKHQFQQKENQMKNLKITILLIMLPLVALSYFIYRIIKNGNKSFKSIFSAQERMQANYETIQEEVIKSSHLITQLLDYQITNNLPQQKDHGLALKVADEVVRIEANLSHMDNTLKGYKQLAKAVERIKANFLANGYEIVDMLGKPFHEGMKVVANFIMDDSLLPNEQRITGIIKPQINYNGKMIQSAQITVSQNL